ncbi:MAG: acyloxyacyl hydrolase [Balneolaceae bacterium]|nr:acyloxyacyl hydrolase [Balneolaceae bacterium]
MTAHTDTSTSVSEFLQDYKISGKKVGIHEFAFWGGYSFHSTKGVWGKTAGADLSMLGFRYNRKLLALPKNYLLKYVGEMNLHVNYQFSDISRRVTASSIGGFGVAPVGFQLNWGKHRTVQPFLKSSTGFIYLSDPFPDRRGTRFNFILELGTGLEIKLFDHSFLTLGYKYHHMSNGRLGDVNPGLDSNIFYAGFTVF